MNMASETLRLRTKRLNFKINRDLNTYQNHPHLNFLVLNFKNYSFHQSTIWKKISGPEK